MIHEYNRVDDKILLESTESVLPYVLDFVELVEKWIEKELSFLKNKVVGVLLWGSYVKGEETSRSDIDVCIVAGKETLINILKEVWHKVNLEKRNYDVKIFEELPLFLKIELIIKLFLQETKKNYFNIFIVNQRQENSRFQSCSSIALK